MPLMVGSVRDNRTHSMRRLVVWATVAFVGALFSATAAEAQPNVHQRGLIRSTTPVEIDSGWCSAPVNSERGARENREQVVFSTVVKAPDQADWIRIFFGECTLSGSLHKNTAAKVRLTSMQDSAVHVLDARGLAVWRRSSAYFNGNRVLVELLAGGSNEPSRLRIDRIQSGSGYSMTPLSICGGVDDRVPSSDPRVGRITPILCTAFLLDDPGGCLLTAGHCAAFENGAEMDVLEFNVPLSDPDGSVNFAPPQDQYPIDPDSIQYESNGITNDWCYFGALPNTMTGLTPSEAQGDGYALADPVPAPDLTTIRVTGFGQDDDDDQSNYTQQTDTGVFDFIDPFNIEYDDIDTKGGNSGSPVIKENENVVIGIHVGGGCDQPGFESNFAYRVDTLAIQNALNNPQGTCEQDVEPCNPDAGPCDQANGTPGCADSACCETVCAFDAFCCEAAWDATCADGAADLCAEPSCPADIDGNQTVNVADLLGLLSNWGPCDGQCAGNLDGNTVVDVNDLLLLLADWGPCE